MIYQVVYRLEGEDEDVWGFDSISNRKPEAIRAANLHVTQGRQARIDVFNHSGVYQFTLERAGHIWQLQL